MSWQAARARNSFDRSLALRLEGRSDVALNRQSDTPLGFEAGGLLLPSQTLQQPQCLVPTLVQVVRGHSRISSSLKTLQEVPPFGKRRITITRTLVDVRDHEVGPPCPQVILAPLYKPAFVAEQLLTPDFAWLLELPMHFIGHSRGASLIASLADHLGRTGVWVDQLTFLDTHPLSRDYDDGNTVNTPDNVVFADTYYRQGGFLNDEPLDVDGYAAGGSFAVELDEETLDESYDQPPNGYYLEHRDVHLWYRGTVTPLATIRHGDLSGTEGSKWAMLTNSMRSDWYQPSMQNGQSTGFYYSRSGIGFAQRPLSGIHDGMTFQEGDGEGVRDPVSVGSRVWPNVLDVDVRGSRSVAIGGSLSFEYQYTDADSTVTVELYLDTDLNPFNGRGDRIWTRADAASDNQIGRILDSAAMPYDVAVGTFYLLARATDGARARFMYAPGVVTIRDDSGGGDSSTGEWREMAKLLTADRALGNDEFGGSVSLRGDTALIGARYDDENGRKSGSAYIFRRNEGLWRQEAKLLPEDGSMLDEFGGSVSLSDDTALIGGAGRGLGSVYVFRRNNDGVWEQEAKLLPDDGPVFNGFGRSVSLSGDTALIGAYTDNDCGYDSGAAYIFTRLDGVWTQRVKLLASDGAAWDNFGYSVSLSGDTAMIGARADQNDNAWAGSAYVFTRSGDIWTQQAKLLPTDGATRDYFGSCLSLSGDTAIIGTDRKDSRYSDSAYVFARIGGVWTQQAKLLPTDGSIRDHDVLSVSVSGDTALIGASTEWDNGVRYGLAYMFSHSGGVWTQQATLLPHDGGAREFFGNDQFGSSVSLWGETALIGRHYDHDDDGYRAGSAYVFAIGTDTETDLWRATDGTLVSGSMTTDGWILVTTVNSNGDPIVFEQRTAEDWVAHNLRDLVGSSVVTGNIETWTDPLNGLTYAAATTAQGLVLYRRAADGSWSYRTLNNDLPGAGVIVGDITVFIGKDDHVYIAGLDSQGDLILFEGVSGADWIAENLAEGDLASQSQSMPVFAGPIISYVTEWNGLNIAGLDANGDIRALWWAPGRQFWSAANLSDITGAPRLTSGLTAYVTDWGGINIIGLDSSGSVLGTWWVPAFKGNWRVSDLTAIIGGPRLIGTSVTSFVSPWGALNIAGLDSNGRLRVYWWTPSTEWQIADITGNATSDEYPVGPVRGLALRDPARLNVFSSAENGDVLRFWWQVGTQWQVQNLSASS